MLIRHRMQAALLARATVFADEIARFDCGDAFAWITSLRRVADIDVPFAYPRGDELRYSAQFAEVCAAASDALRAVSR